MSYGLAEQIAFAYQENNSGNVSKFLEGGLEIAEEIALHGESSRSMVVAEEDIAYALAYGDGGALDRLVSDATARLERRITGEQLADFSRRVAEWRSSYGERIGAVVAHERSRLMSELAPILERRANPDDGDENLIRKREALERFEAFQERVRRALSDIENRDSQDSGCLREVLGYARRALARVDASFPADDPQRVETERILNQAIVLVTEDTDPDDFGVPGCVMAELRNGSERVTAARSLDEGSIATDKILEGAQGGETIIYIADIRLPDSKGSSPDEGTGITMIHWLAICVERWNRAHPDNPPITVYTFINSTEFKDMDCFRRKYGPELNERVMQTVIGGMQGNAGKHSAYSGVKQCLVELLKSQS